MCDCIVTQPAEVDIDAGFQFSVTKLSFVQNKLNPPPHPPPGSHLDPAALALVASLLRPWLAADAFTDGADLVAGYGQTARLSVVQVLQGHLELVPVVLSLAGALSTVKKNEKRATQTDDRKHRAANTTTQNMYINTRWKKTNSC